MRIVCTLALILMVTLKSIDFSSQFDCLPNGDPIPDVHRSRPSSSPERHQSPESPHSSVRSCPPAETHLRARSRSTPASRRYVQQPALKLETLRFARLIPNANPNRLFEVRRYNFPHDKRIKLRDNGRTLVPIPTEEQTVLSTSNADVFAILGRNNTILRGIYIRRYAYKAEIRVKINMDSGSVEDMTGEEMAESPLGKNRPISRNFKIVFVDDLLP